MARAVFEKSRNDKEFVKALVGISNGEYDMAKQILVNPKYKNIVDALKKVDPNLGNDALRVLLSYSYGYGDTQGKNLTKIEPKLMNEKRTPAVRTAE